MIRVQYVVRVDRPHGKFVPALNDVPPSCLQDAFVCDTPEQLLGKLAEVAGTVGFFAERVIEADNHECGTGLNGAHCAGCGSDYCTVCGHNCTMR